MTSTTYGGTVVEESNTASMWQVKTGYHAQYYGGSTIGGVSVRSEQSGPNPSKEGPDK